jgi:riboflavin biosynthesis pyrimidine reductase
MRPKIICHMASSVDGRLLADRWTPPASGVATDIVPRIYEEAGKRLAADGFLVGRNTMTEFEGVTIGEPSSGGAQRRDSHRGDRAGRSIAVVVDPQGKLYYAVDHAEGDHIVAILGEQVSDDYLSELRRVGVSYLFAGREGKDLHAAMDALGDAFGIKTLLLEGGGLINGAFLKAGLIDEISVLVYPGIDGLAGIPSIFDYAGADNDQPAAGKALRHLATETLEGGMVWLRYSFEDAPLGQ